MRAWLHAAFHEPETRVYAVVQTLVWTLIFLSIGMLVAEPLLPSHTGLADVLHIADRALLGIFAVEYVCRVGSFQPAGLGTASGPRPEAGWVAAWP